MEIINIITGIWSFISIPCIIWKWIRNRFFKYNLQFNILYHLPMEDYNDGFLKFKSLMDAKDTNSIVQIQNRYLTIGHPPYSIIIKNIGDNDLPPCNIDIIRTFDNGTFSIKNFIYKTELNDGLKINATHSIYIHRFDKDFKIDKSLVECTLSPDEIRINNNIFNDSPEYFMLNIIQNSGKCIIYKNKIVGRHIFNLLKKLWLTRNNILSQSPPGGFYFNRTEYFKSCIKNIIPKYLKLWRSTFSKMNCF